MGPLCVKKSVAFYALVLLLFSGVLMAVMDCRCDTVQGRIAVHIATEAAVTCAYIIKQDSYPAACVHVLWGCSWTTGLVWHQMPTCCTVGMTTFVVCHSATASLLMMNLLLKLQPAQHLPLISLSLAVECFGRTVQRRWLVCIDFYSSFVNMLAVITARLIVFIIWVSIFSQFLVWMHSLMSLLSLRKWGNMFSLALVCLSVCVSVCDRDN